jgi:hypothetical protein
MLSGKESSMITFDRGNVRFTYRVAGVAIRDGKVLAQKSVEGSYCFLPGGRAELRETAGETLRREMQEELHVDVAVGRLLWVVENFFELGGKAFHELGLYFSMTFPGGCKIFCVSGQPDKRKKWKMEGERDDHSTRIDRRIAERLLRSA